MVAEDSSKYWLAFASIEKVGSVFVKTLFDYYGSIKSAWCAGADDLLRIEKFTPRQVNDFLKAREKTNPDDCLEYIEEKGIKYINYTDKDFPELLKNIPAAPVTLFYKGDLSSCNFERTLSIVGSRKASESAKTILSSIISEFKDTDLCIVSGLATGIDSCAHKAALKNGLKTIGVIASGFDYIYPTQNKDLYKQIENGGGVIFSEYWPSFQPLTWRFPHRNRIVTGLSKGTLVAEAAIKSGALISANYCLEQGRELMCLPGLITNPNTEGIYKLIKNGAAVITKAQDILDALDWEIKQNPSTSKETDFSQIENINEQEKIILEYIAKQDSTTDELCAATGIDFSDLTVALMNLELNGYIKQTDGGRYLLATNLH